MKYVKLNDLNRQAEIAICVLRDMTADRKIQNTPRGKEELRCMLYENSADIDWEVDLNGSGITVTPMIRLETR